MGRRRMKRRMRLKTQQLLYYFYTFYLNLFISEGILKITESKKHENIKVAGVLCVCLSLPKMSSLLLNLYGSPCNVAPIKALSNLDWSVKTSNV